MIFNSYIFFLFLGMVLPLFYGLPSKKSKNIFLLLASYFFYGYWDWRFCLLLAFTTLTDFFIGAKLANSTHDKTRKQWLVASLVINLGVLAFFKYFNFFIENVEVVSRKLGMPLDFVHLNIILPVGLSFYIFHNLSYIIDIYRRRIQPSNNIIDFGLFVAFFPQLVAGPIGRSDALLPQFSKKLKPTREQLSGGITLIIYGLFKKVMIGDTTGRYVDHIFENMTEYKAFEILCALVLFSVQIYADFSGYSHIARGVSKLVGVELMKNFEQPYLSRNITEFWRRWHISLSTWLRDYLYIPLGGNRKGEVRTYLNLALTMLLGGLWHGASWNFVVWGGLHGLYLAIHKLITKEAIIPSDNLKSFRIKDVVQILFTNLLVLFTWLFFRSTTWATTQLFFSKIILWEPSENAFWFATTTLTFMALTIITDLCEYLTRKHIFLLEIKAAGFRIGILTALFLFTMLYIYQSKPMPFLYFKF
jgi:alginate O-acetyltransferase complex protein AlgI